MNTIPELKPGVACLRKKETDKLKVEKVDERAIMYAEFIEQIQMYGGRWNRFQYNRGWTWIQSDVSS